ncbi:MAG: V-type ATPase subunit [bacterium]
MIKIPCHIIPDDTRYAFAVGKIRALETRLLDNSFISRLIKAGETEEMLKILMDSEYNFSLNETGEAPFESMIDKELHRIYMLIGSIDPEPEWTDLWRWRYDAHNLKVLLKVGLTDEKALEHCVPLGIIDPKLLLQQLQQADYSQLPVSFKEVIDEILSDKDKEQLQDGFEIDFLIDRALFEYLAQETRRSKNEFMINLATMMIDLTNLRTFLRMKQIKIPGNIFSRSFIPGGWIKEKAFFPQEEKSPYEIALDIIEKTPYTDLKPALDSKNLAVLESAMDNFIIAFLRQTRQRAFGVEPLIGYMMAKEMETKNLRIIYVCKVNDVDEARIKERLRETYV